MIDERQAIKMVAIGWTEQQIGKAQELLRERGVSFEMSASDTFRIAESDWPKFRQVEREVAA